MPGSLASNILYFTLGFMESLVYASLFTYHYGVVHIYLLIYVNDILITSTHLTYIVQFIHHLQQEFPLKDLAQLLLFLGPSCNL